MGHSLAVQYLQYKQFQQHHLQTFAHPAVECFHDLTHVLNKIGGFIHFLYLAVYVGGLDNL